ncbi:TPA: hypothetical protein DDX46_02020 [Candidatus Saccharibacteria bacterium]|nr:MAG: hypothetical protein A2791_01265 [Candidatus Saccharibacteria bacterium RIFCSPHIGHO2_01_FULL_46_30]OGL34008.1 MAG: hypothetical protein A3E20_05325 [Candidatus Saccharibacteria bacterium RIFCSPHIGHO2_12_FULL_47_16]HBH77503.1 hypothetical protein [Candidatus Saccharibacteria bacterium]
MNMNPDQQTPVPAPRRASPGVGGVLSKIIQIIWLLVTIIVILLIIRVVFSLIGVDQTNGFATFIYNTTYIFVEPFRGLLQVGEFQYGRARLEFETIIAIFIYLLAGWGLTAAAQVLRK